MFGSSDLLMFPPIRSLPKRSALSRATRCSRPERVSRPTGLPALADDSGLAVDVLNQMPGVRSARWAGPDASDEENNALLLRQLADVPPADRTARFVCAMALVLPDGAEHVRLGEMQGRIAVSPAGQNGFGYDPLFVADGYTVTNGELEPAAKDAISHRGRAVRAIVPVLMCGAAPVGTVARSASHAGRPQTRRG